MYETHNDDLDDMGRAALRRELRKTLAFEPTDGPIHVDELRRAIRRLRQRPAGGQRLVTDGGEERCTVCGRPLDGETTSTPNGSAHVECAEADPESGADFVPDGGRAASVAEGYRCDYCREFPKPLRPHCVVGRETIPNLCDDCYSELSRQGRLDVDRDREVFDY